MEEYDIQVTSSSTKEYDYLRDKYEKEVFDLIKEQYTMKSVSSECTCEIRTFKPFINEQNVVKKNPDISFDIFWVFDNKKKLIGFAKIKSMKVKNIKKDPKIMPAVYIHGEVAVAWKTKHTQDKDIQKNFKEDFIIEELVVTAKTIDLKNTIMILSKRKGPKYKGVGRHLLKYIVDYYNENIYIIPITAKYFESVSHHLCSCHIDEDGKKKMNKEIQSMLHVYEKFNFKLLKSYHYVSGCASGEGYFYIFFPVMMINKSSNKLN